jgi:hypothetical protein
MTMTTKFLSELMIVLLDDASDFASHDGRGRRPREPTMGNWDNDELDEADDFDSDDSPAETIVCSNCGASIYEDSVRCPHCGWYLTSDTSV